jgi:hypothetical protein
MMISTARSVWASKSSIASNNSTSSSGGSFASLLGKAKSAKASNSSRTVAKPATLEPSAEVERTLVQLQEQELAATRLVGETIKRQEGVTGRDKSRGSRLNQKSQEFLQEQQRLRSEPKVLSAWDELARGELGARSKFQQKLSSVGNVGGGCDKRRG